MSMRMIDRDYQKKDLYTLVVVVVQLLAVALATGGVLIGDAITLLFAIFLMLSTLVMKDSR